MLALVESRWSEALCHRHHRVSHWSHSSRFYVFTGGVFPKPEDRSLRFCRRVRGEGGGDRAGRFAFALPALYAELSGDCLLGKGVMFPMILSLSTIHLSNLALSRSRAPWSCPTSTPQARM